MAIRNSKKLRKNITEKKTVDFTYRNKKGEVKKRKNVEVHVHGYSKTGKSTIRAYEPGKGWRMFNSSSITSMKETGKDYKRTRPQYNPGDRGMKKVTTATKKTNGNRKATKRKK